MKADQNPDRRKLLQRLGLVAGAVYAAPLPMNISDAHAASGASTASAASAASTASAASAASLASGVSASSAVSTPSVVSGPSLCLDVLGIEVACNP